MGARAVIGAAFATRNLGFRSIRDVFTACQCPKGPEAAHALQSMAANDKPTAGWRLSDSICRLTYALLTRGGGGAGGKVAMFSAGWRVGCHVNSGPPFAPPPVYTSVRVSSPPLPLFFGT